MPGSDEKPSQQTFETLTPQALFALGLLVRIGPVDPEWLEGVLERPPFPKESAGEAMAALQTLELVALEPSPEDPDEPLLAARVTDAQRALVLERLDAERPARRQALIQAVSSRLKVEERSPLGAALRELDRIHCAPEERALLADVDIPIVISGDMTESAPHAVLMTVQAVDPKPGDHVLICGAKGGYLAALIATLVGEKGHVTCLDWQPEVADFARRALGRFPSLAGRVTVEVHPDVTLGLSRDLPWNVTIVNGALPKIPYPLLTQLHDERGRLLFYLSNGRTATCYVIRKNQEIVQEEELSKFRITSIVGRYGFDAMGELQAQYEATKAAGSGASDLAALQQRLPYPLARALLAAVNTKEASDRHMRTLKAYEAVMKYLAFVALAAFDDTGRKDPRVAGALRTLAGKPTLGTWPAAIGLVSDSVREHAVGQLVVGDWERTVRGGALSDAVRQLAPEGGEPRPGASRGTKVRDLLHQVVSYRNKSGEGHGAVASMGQLQERARLLQDALLAVLSRMRLFQELDLLYVESNERLKRGRFKITARRLKGTQPAVETWEAAAEDADFDSDLVCLARGRAVVLPLSPWLVWAEGKHREPELFLYNWREGKRLHYLTYHNSDEYPAEAAEEAMASLLERHPAPAVVHDPVQAKAQFLELLRTFAADNVIQRHEMETLRAYLPKIGLVATPDEAPGYVRRVLDEAFPGVYVEE